jgi:GH24 family phage-related lysozyme (muramidase)
MHESVSKIFPEFSAGFEGVVNHPYLDVLGLVTVGIGCLIDPLPLALALSWHLSDTGARATPLQVSAQWVYLKGEKDLAREGARAAEQITRLRLTDADVDALLESRMQLNEAVLAKSFAGWSNYPADAQLGIHSMAWAMGAGFAKEYPHFKRAAEAGSWDEAADECTIGGETANKGLVPRNIANRICFRNAARVIANPGALRVTETYWPLELT